MLKSNMSSLIIVRINFWRKFVLPSTFKGIELPTSAALQLDIKGLLNADEVSYRL